LVAVSDPHDAAPPADDAALTILVAAVLSSAVRAAVEMRALVQRASGQPHRDGPASIPPVLDAAFDVALRATAVVADGAVLLGRVGQRAALRTPRPPAIPSGSWPLPALARSAERGRNARVKGDQIARELAGKVVDEVLDRIDLTRLVAERVNIGDVVAGIDLAGIVKEVIDEIDLPELIRESRGAAASDTEVDRQIRDIEVDERVNKAIGQVLLRRGNANAVAAHPEVGSDG
jgi:hypothetical protein